MPSDFTKSERHSEGVIIKGGMKTKALNDQKIYRAIDADAHAANTEDLWSYLEGLDKKFRPQLFQLDENPNTKLSVMDDRPIGLRNPTLTVA